MSISIVDYALPYETHNKYDVFFHSNIIHTLVTHTPSIVDDWLSNILRSHPNNHLLIGLGVEWLPNTRRNMDNPVAVLQLCNGEECLVFQIMHAPFIPQSLIAFLRKETHTFVGVGIQQDVDKLMRDYSLRVGNFVELRTLAVERLGELEMRNAGLKTLGLRVLGKDLEKPKKVTLSRWNNLQLTEKQVQYACVDAFVSFEVGRRLYSPRV